MAEEKQVFNITPVNGEIIIRHGDALPQKKVQPFTPTTTVDSLFHYYERRQSAQCSATYFHDLKSVLCISLVAGTANLLQDKNDPDADSLLGVLIQNEAHLDLGINTGKEWMPADLSDKLRRNRHLFADQSECLRIVAALKNLKVSQKGEIETADDNRGNKTQVFKQAIESNIPVSFSMVFAPYVGGQPVTIAVDIFLSVTGQTIRCQLDSVDLIQVMEREKTVIFDRLVENFAETGIPILYV